MPRRIQNRMACQRCRKKRAKCDGQAPCRRCHEAGEGCVYDQTRRESKDDLWAEIERLKQRSEESDRLINALSNLQDAAAFNSLIQELVEGSKPRRVVLQELTEPDDGDQARPPRHGTPRKPPVESPASDPGGGGGGGPVCPHCSGRLPASLAAAGGAPATATARRPSSSGDSAYAEPTEPAAASAVLTPVSLPSQPLDGSGPGSGPGSGSHSHSHSQPLVDRWTRAGWTVASVRHLLDALLTWDYLPFCLLCKDSFLRDYHGSSARYCSSALVNALLALATRVLNENDGGAPCAGWSGSKAFFDEAEAILHGSALSSSLPDIQALGILSLYQISCGRAPEAQELAEAFASSIADLCSREPLAGTRDDEYARARATTYCGAISLIRILRLTTGQLFGQPVVRDDAVFLEQPPGGSGYGYGGERSHRVTRPAADLDCHSSQLCNLQLIPAKIFQLTEWVYKLLAAARLPNAQVGQGDVVAVYTKCLDWYQSFFAILRTDGSDTPFMLFVHMYYQFCLVCLFRPFVHMCLADSDIQPREICQQAAQSILALAQSYSGLFTLRRVSAFVPFFVCAAGSVSLPADAGPPPYDMGRAPPAAVKAEPDLGGPGFHRPAPAPAKTPAVGHAQMLLAEMSSTHMHWVTALAERKLRGASSS